MKWWFCIHPLHTIRYFVSSTPSFLGYFIFMVQKLSLSSLTPYRQYSTSLIIHLLFPLFQNAFSSFPMFQDVMGKTEQNIQDSGKFIHLKHVFCTAPILQQFLIFLFTKVFSRERYHFYLSENTLILILESFP